MIVGCKTRQRITRDQAQHWLYVIDAWPQAGFGGGEKSSKPCFALGRKKQKCAAASPDYITSPAGCCASPAWHKLGPADLLVVYDDMDLPPGKLRIRPEGGAGGHKGMESIIMALGTEGFPRLRIGVGKPEVPGFNGAGYVLSRLTADDAKTFEESVDTAAEAIHCIVSEGLEKAMNEYNRK